MSKMLGESLCAEFLRLQEEARLARQRFHLYKARIYGPRPTDPVLVVRLERASLLAENRLRRANPAANPSRVPDAAVRR
jgi:hypothetical protein